MAFPHANDDKTLLATVLAVVQALDGKWIFEDRRREFEAHTIVAIIGVGLGVVPFEFRFS